jgi:FkbM family methyltransferase
VKEKGPSEISKDFFFRPDTTDKDIFDLVFVGNEYRLPSKFPESSVVIDIGGHIGSFSAAACERGAPHVFCYEASEANYASAKTNLARYGSRVHLFNLAVGRSDNEEQNFKIGEFGTTASGAINTGGVAVIFEQDGPSLPTVPFDDVVSAALAKTGASQIGLLKIDCEGSEWPILYTSGKLKFIEAICGEFHELGGAFNAIPSPFGEFAGRKCEASHLALFLRELGFSSVFIRNHNSQGEESPFGLFFAVRRRCSADYFKFVFIRKPFLLLKKFTMLWLRRLGASLGVIQ